MHYFKTKILKYKFLPQLKFSYVWAYYLTMRHILIVYHHNKILTAQFHFPATYNNKQKAH